MKIIIPVLICIFMIVNPFFVNCSANMTESDLRLTDTIKVLVSLGILPEGTNVDECNTTDITRREAFLIACNTRGGIYYEKYMQTLYTEEQWAEAFALGCCIIMEDEDYLPDVFSDISRSDEDYDLAIAAYGYGLLQGKQLYGEKITADFDSILTQSEMHCIINRLPRPARNNTIPGNDKPVKKSEFINAIHPVLYISYFDNRYGYMRVSNLIDDLVNLKYLSEKK